MVIRRIRFWIIGLTAFAAILVWLARHAGSVLVVDAPERADVIVVLAGETDRRPTRGLQLLDQGYARRVLIDVPAGASMFGFSEVQLAEKYAHDLPEGSSVRICPIVGLSTRDESHDAERCVNQENASRVLVVTSDFHTRRALSIFRHELRGKTFSVAAAYDASQFGSNWWSNRQWAKTCLEEWMKVAWWNAVDRWR
jgi:DUF218 domain-containing protein